MPDLVSELSYGLVMYLAHSISVSEATGPVPSAPFLPPRDLAMCLWALGAMRVRPGRAWWGPVLLAIEAMVARPSAELGPVGGQRAVALEAQPLAMTVWALGRLRVRPPEALGQALLSAAVSLSAPQQGKEGIGGAGRRSGGPGGARSLAMMLNGLVWSLRSAPIGEARAALSGRVGGLLIGQRGGGGGGRGPQPSALNGAVAQEEMDPQSLTTLLWASAKLRLSLSPRQVEAAVAAARKLLPTCPDAKLVVVCCWSLCRLGARPGEAWLDEIETLAEIRYVGIRGRPDEV